MSDLSSYSNYPGGRFYAPWSEWVGLPEAEDRARKDQDELREARSKYLAWQLKHYDWGDDIKLPDNPLTTNWVYWRRKWDPRFEMVKDPSFQGWQRKTIETPKYVETSEAWGAAPDDRIAKTAGVWDDVTGWASDKVDAAKGWAKDKLEEVVEPVFQPIQEVLDNRLGAPGKTGIPDDPKKKPSERIMPYIKLPKDIPDPIRQGFGDAIDEWFENGRNLNVFESGKLNPNLFSSDAFKALKTNEEKWDYLQRVATKAGVFQYLTDQIKLNNSDMPNPVDLYLHPEKLYDLPQQILDKPEFFDSFLTAADKGDMGALEFFQWAESKWKGGTTGSTPGGDAAPAGNKGVRINLSEDQKNKIKAVAQRVLWREVKADPLRNIPKAIAMFLRMYGYDQMADFARDPIKFYSSLAAVLLGGAVILGTDNDDDEDERQLINSGKHVDPRMTQVPYSPRQRLT